MTPRQYKFASNARFVAIAIGLIYLVFGAGAVFTGYKPTTLNYLVTLIMIVNLVNAIINKPTLPHEQSAGKTPETK